MIYLAVASIQQLPVIGLVQFHLMDIIRTTIKTATGSCQGVFFFIAMRGLRTRCFPTDKRALL